MKQCITAHTLDLDFLVNYLSTYTCEQRLIVVHDVEYEYSYKLIDMVLERPESPMRSCTVAMLTEPIELYVRDFHDLLILKQTGKTHDDISRGLVEILLALNNEDTRKLRELYEQLFESPIEKDIEIVLGETSIVSKLLIEFIKGKRYEEPSSSTSIAKAIAKKLYEAGEGTPGIDYDTFIKIFSRDAFSQLSAIFDIYEDLYKRPIQEAIEREFQGRSETECFQDIVEFTRSPAGYYAKILRQAFNKKPVDYITIIRTIIGHEDKDLSEIKLEYSKIYDETLEQTIQNHVEFAEMKRLFIHIIHKGGENTADDDGPVHFDHANNSSSTAAYPTAPSTPPANGMRRNLSHEAFDKIVHVFKNIRPH